MNGNSQGVANKNNVNYQLMPLQNFQYNTFNKLEFEQYYKSRTPSQSSFVSQQGIIQRPLFQKFYPSHNDIYHQRQSSLNSNSDRNSLIVNQTYKFYQNERQRSQDFQRNQLNNQNILSISKGSLKDQLPLNNQNEYHNNPNIARNKSQENQFKNETNQKQLNQNEQYQLKNDKLSLDDNNLQCCYPTISESTQMIQTNNKMTDIFVDFDSRQNKQNDLEIRKFSEHQTDNLIDKVNKVNQIQQEIRLKIQQFKEKVKDGSEYSFHNSSKQSIDYQYGQSIISSNNKKIPNNVDSNYKYENFQFSKNFEDYDHKYLKPEGDRDVLESGIRQADLKLESSIKPYYFENKKLYEIPDIKKNFTKSNKQTPNESIQIDKEMRYDQLELQEKLLYKNFQDFNRKNEQFKSLKSEKSYQDFYNDQKIKSENNYLKPNFKFDNHQIESVKISNNSKQLLNQNEIKFQQYSNNLGSIKYPLSIDDQILKDELKQNYLNLQNDIYQKKFSQNLLESIKKNNYFASLSEKEQYILIQLIQYMSNLKIYEEDYPQQIRKQLEILTNIIQANRQVNQEKNQMKSESQHLIREIKDQFDYNYNHPYNSKFKYRSLTPPSLANVSEIKIKARNKSIGHSQKLSNVSKSQKKLAKPLSMTQNLESPKQKSKALSIYQQILGEVKKIDKKSKIKQPSQVYMQKDETQQQKQEQYHIQRVLQKTHSQIQYDNLLNQNAQAKYDVKQNHSRKTSVEKLFEKPKQKQAQQINKTTNQGSKNLINKKVQQKPQIQENKLFLELFIKNVKKNFKKKLSQFELQKLYIQMLRKRWGKNYQSNLSQQELFKIIYSDSKSNEQFYMIEQPSQQIEQIQDDNHFDDFSGFQANQELFEFV